jgi:hypothetical protein
VVTDVLALADEEPLHRFDYQPVPGFGSDVCGPDTFRRIEMIDGRPGIPGGPSYQLITVAHGGTMSVARLRKLRDLVTAGANLLGEPPVSTPGLENLPAADAELAALAKELWGETQASERKVGAGRVFRGIPAEEALRRIVATPSFSGPGHLSWIHRRAGAAELFFIASSSQQETINECVLRAPSGSSAELWNPLTGQIHSLAATVAGPGTFRVKFPLDAHGSTFVVFRPGPSSAPAFEIPPATTTTLALAGPWQLAFPHSSGVGSPLTLAKLTSWCSHENPAVRHFSGTAAYRTEFSIQSVPSRAVLDLGRVEVMARVKLNGQDLGILWRPPYQVEATRALKAGQNTLEIEVVNLWPNRLIGDAALPEDAERDDKGLLLSWPEWLLKGQPNPSGRSTFVTFPLWKKDEKLQPSGLLGPVLLKSAAAN